jgi:hypothetical protein
VFHFKRDTVEFRARHGDRAFDVVRRKRYESGLTLFEGFDYAV